jgi:membrane protein implicated in regulation of membrane protease activity
VDVAADGAAATVDIVGDNSSGGLMDLASPEAWRWIWIGAVVVFTIGEIAVAGSLFFLPFAIGAALAAAVAFAGGALPLEWLVFVVASTASMALLWPVGRRLDRNAPSAKVGANRWVGREAVVVSAIPGGAGSTGLVRVEREEWRAESLTAAPITSGSTVLVSRVDGTRLVVLPLEEALPEFPEPS